MKFKNQKREMTLTSDVLSDNNDRTVLLAFSSENPVVRTIGGQEYNEILLHNPENVNLERLQNKAALLYNHNFDNHIGVIESASIDADHVGRALVRFSSVGMGAEKFEMVRESTLSKVSVGYSILDYRIEGDNLLVTQWEPYEISMVSVPADDLVGVGRSLEEQEPEQEETETENNDEQPTEKEEQRQEETENEPDENTESTTSTSESDPEIDTEAETINNNDSTGNGEQPEPEEQNDDSAVQEEQAEEDQKRIAEINAISRAFNIHAEITNQAIETGLSIDAFRQQIKNKPIIKDDKMEFSLNSLIRSIMDGDKSLPSGKNGAVVANADFAQAVRAGVTTTSAKDIIHTDVLYGSFVDILRAESVLKNFPVQMFTGLTSEIAVPKLVADFANSFGFISENGVSPEVDANFESVVLKPKTFTGSVPLSRSVVKSCPQVEQIVSQAIVAGSAERLEALILKGIVDAVVAAGKVETVDAYTYAGIVAAQGQLGDEGVSYGSIAAVMSPQTKATLRSTLRGDNTAGVYLFDEGDLCGVPAYDSKVLAGQNFIILGDFSKVAIAQWGDSLELDMDDTTNRNRGSVIARVWADLDFAVLVPEAFRIIKLA
ncbi:phage major capsid protein [Leclercia tamurae]|uniref:Phage major capsid protein n=1 Tax=Leclercia tamurae TaxID=2926467 RepID=A0ABT2RGP8_9ENTR|nr:phage major capsid protein [Leclercia tamurae]MCU6680003.1 phage major capsid protein [Leclercia tamurae]